MPVAIGVENHPQVRQIIDWALAGESARSIAKRVKPPLSNVTISRFVTQRVKPTLAQTVDFAKALQTNTIAEALTRPEAQLPGVSQVANDAVRRATIWERIEKRYKTCEDGLQLAKSKEDPSSMASVMRAEQGYMRLDAELSGLLQQAGPQTQVMIVCPAQNQQVTANTSSNTEGAVTIDIKAAK